LKGFVMKKAQLRNTVAASLMLLAPVAATFVAQPVAAQTRTVAAPVVTGLTLNADEGLSPGSHLALSVTGTPGSRASVQFAGTKIVVALRESQRGVYRGSYTVRRADRIDPTQFMTVRLTRSGVTSRHNFTYPPSFLAQSMGAAPSAPGLAAAPHIERFVTLPAGRLEPGRELRYRVQGAPGAVVTLDIPGVANDLRMREVRPGVYEAEYVVRQRDDLAAFQTAIATLRSGDRWVTSRLDRAFARDRDNRAPQIVELTPRQGDVVSPAGTTLIAGEFEDRDGRGVDPRTVRLMVDGRDVTHQADITSERFRYRSDLPLGQHTAEITARDHAGNVVNRSWSFQVGGEQRFSGGPLPLQVSSPANGAFVDANGNLFVQGHTAPHASVRVRVDAVPPVIGQMLGVAQIVHDDTVQADRNGYFSVNINPRIAVLPGMRYDVSLRAQSGSQTAESRLTVHQRG
jgi:hypothetical protein